MTLKRGFSARVREWNDVFPWLRLGRTLRIAASPPLVLLMAVVFSIWWFGETLILGSWRQRRSEFILDSELVFEFASNGVP